MKVAFLQASLGFGGAERLVQALMGRLDRTRVASIAIALYEPGPIGEQLAAAGHRVLSRLARNRWDVVGIGRLARALDEERVDLVYVPDSALPLFWAGLLRRRRPLPRLVLGFHSWAKPGDHLQHGIANACAFPVVDRFVALTERHAEFQRERFGLSAARVAIIGSGVDLGCFHPTVDRSAAKRAAGLDPEAVHVGIVASLVYQKDHPLFLRMALRVGKRFPEARFLIIGDGPERRRVEALAGQLGLTRTVHFLGARDDVPTLHRALDVAVLCTLAGLEALPVSLLEAMATGLPVVSTKVGSIPDLVRENETGRMVPAGDEAALAEAVGALLADPARRERMGRAGREAVVARFDIAGMISGYQHLFQEVAS